MKPNIPSSDNHVNVVTGMRRTWRYGERKIVKIDRNEAGIVVGVEQATKEGFIFLGEGHDIVRLEYGKSYVIVFREGGVNNGYWALACESTDPVNDLTRKLEDIQRETAVGILNRRLKPGYTAKLAPDAMEIWQPGRENPTIRAYYAQYFTGKKLLTYTEQLIKDFGLPEGVPDFPR